MNANALGAEGQEETPQHGERGQELREGFMGNTVSEWVLKQALDGDM
jgi:hypothetical protein